MPETSKSRLGKYELLEEIGNGAQGKIFKARCVDPGVPGVAAGELVALKRLRQTGSDTQSEIFKRTTRILRALDHPNIVRYKDSFVWREDELDEEVYCLVTELLEGQTLKELLDRNKAGLTWNRLQAILLPALQALEYAGNHSVIHRDLKPSNIYLTNQGDVKLIDFEIARHQDTEATTSTAGPQGTWDYMAPDFVSRPDNFRGDQQSDIFSFGVCFYQSLTGELPYPPLGSNAQAAYYQRWMRPERLPKVKFSHPIFSVLRGARACIEKCLVFERAARFQTFTEVLAAFNLIQRRRLQHGDGEQYEYLNYIGKGGFGRVFRARRMSDGLEVAVKEVLADRNATRFVREAKMLKVMRHPHLVQYLDFVEVSEHGMGEERRLFLVLEYLQGMPQAGLNDRIKTARSGLDPFEVLSIFSSYLDCLEYLHRNGIIHRDIKPGNLYAPGEAPEQAKIFDLGIAHDTEGTKTHGQVPGTLDYMPYEFASQEGERGTPQSDIYSIGVTLYQALTGKLPFDRLPIDEKKAWITWYERCEKPPEILFNHIVFRTYPELEKLLRRALAVRPEDRFGSAGAMHHEIRAIVENWERARRKKAYENALAGARAAFSRREYDEAARHVRLALEAWPGGVEAGQLLGRIETERQRKTQYETALTAAKEALERDHLDAAVRHVEIALEVWPEGVEARQVFDQIETERRRRTQYDTATTAAKRALGRDDLDTAARHVRIALKVRPEGAEAVRLLDQIETQRRRTVQYDSAITAATEALGQRDYAKALAQADVALKLKPMDSTAQALRSRAEEAMRAMKEPEPKTVAPIEATSFDDGPVTAVTEMEPPPEKPFSGTKGEPDDENVQFTVYRPQIISPQKWYPLLAFAHLSARRPDASPDEPDPLEEVHHQASQALGQKLPSYQPVTQDSNAEIPQKSELTFLPEIPGIEFNPPRATFLWQESVHRQDFRMRAQAELNGQTARGRLTVFLGVRLIADVPLAIRVDSQAAQFTTAPVPEAVTASPYRKVFACYSHKDLRIVLQYEDLCRGLGDEYLRDNVTLCSGEVWSERLAEMIREADIFQLFWSRNSMCSKFARQEWEQALSLRRPNFVRPVYWDIPMPEDREAGLPPEDLRRLQFQFIGRGRRQLLDQRELNRIEKEGHEPKAVATELEPPLEQFCPNIEPEPAIITEPVSDQPGRTLEPVPTLELGPPPPVEPPKRRKQSKVRKLLPIAACIIVVVIAIFVRQKQQQVTLPVTPPVTYVPLTVPSNRPVTPPPPVPKPTNIVQVPKPDALVLYGPGTITHDISDNNPIRLACLARNPHGLDFVPSNSTLLPRDNIRFMPANAAAGKTNGMFAAKVLLVTIRQTEPPRITGLPTNVIRSNGKRSQPIKFMATGRPPIAFDGGFGPELQRKYGLQWKSDAAGTNLIVTLEVEPPLDLQSTETFTAIVRDASRQQVTNKFIFQFVPRTNTWINSIGMKLAWVPNLPGCENSQWTDRANGGWVGLYEVTQDEFTQVLHTNPSKSRAAENGKFPVESMPFEEATRFCEELTGRDGQLLPAGWHYALPTEEQWEFFAAGTAVDTKNAYYAPPGIKKPNMPQEVGRLAPNLFGLYDVLGNVAELTCTRWHYSANANETSLYICRGGGFDSISTVLSPDRRQVVDKVSWMFTGPAPDIGFRVILIPH
jgi:serine/threonine protein kinase